MRALISKPDGVWEVKVIFGRTNKRNRVAAHKALDRAIDEAAEVDKVNKKVLGATWYVEPRAAKGE